jgi:hypothetical protein
MKDARLFHVARLARVPDENQAKFLRNVGYAILRAEKESVQPKGKNTSAAALRRDFFDPIVRAAKNLRIKLERLQGDHIKAGEAPRSMSAGHFFSEALQGRSHALDPADPITHFLGSMKLDLVIEVTEHARSRAERSLSKPGRKKGTGKPAFDMFVMRLLVAAEVTGGRLPIYKTSYGRDPWAGSLPKAVRQLRPLLPRSNFWPAGKLGYSLHTVYQRWRLESRKIS